jgi:hypothetical protein
MRTEVEIPAKLIKDDEGNWSLTLTPQDHKAKQLLGELTEVEAMDENAKTLFLTQAFSCIQGEKVEIVDFNINRGPDIVGHQQELEELSAWQPESLRKNSSEI